MRQEVKRWLQQAKEDLDAAEYNFKGGRFRLAAFMCQQTAEKALKALLINRTNAFPKIHDLGGRKSELIGRLKDFKKKNRIEKMYLFGSMMSGKTHRWSDVDLIVVSKRFRGKGLLERAPVLYMEWDLKYPVDFLCYTPEEFKKLSRQITIVSEAVREGIEI